MRGIHRKVGRLTAAVLVGVALAVSACSTTDRNLKRLEEVVTPINSGEAAAVSADDLASAMLQAGFKVETILRHGPAVRNALATAGGAQLREGEVVEALFSIYDEQLYVTSRMRGTFVQPLYPEAPEA